VITVMHLGLSIKTDKFVEKLRKLQPVSFAYYSTLNMYSLTYRFRTKFVVTVSIR